MDNETREEQSSLIARINVVLPLQTSIALEKEADKMGLKKSQYARLAIEDKLSNTTRPDISHDLAAVQQEIKELKALVLALLAQLNAEKTLKSSQLSLIS